MIADETSLSYSGCVPAAMNPPLRPLTAVSATSALAELIRERVPGWHMDTVHGFLYVFGDPQADVPGRQIVCDGLTDRPIVSGNAGGLRVEITVPPVSDRTDRQRVLDILQTAGVLPGTQ